MKDRRHLLKIKLKSLAAEARIIRRAERKLALPTTGLPRKAFTKEERDAAPEPVKTAAQAMRLAVRMARAKARQAPWYDENRAELAAIQEHRKLPLRRAARATHLAYGFLRGRTYEQMEGTRKLPNDSIFERANEEKLFQEAAKMAMTYGAADVAKCDIERDFKEWTVRKDAKLVYGMDEGKLRQGLVSPPKPNEFGALLS